jgi:hypothetical protein
MREEFKAYYRTFKEADKGERFMALCQKWQQGKDQHSLLATGLMILGALLVVGGIVAPIAPTPFGFLLVIAGVVLIVGQSRRVASWCNRCEVMLRG